MFSFNSLEPTNASALPSLSSLLEGKSIIYGKIAPSIYIPEDHELSIFTNQIYDGID
jgi:hypothetical protein